MVWNYLGAIIWLTKMQVYFGINWVNRISDTLQKDFIYFFNSEGAIEAKCSLSPRIVWSSNWSDNRNSDTSNHFRIRLLQYATRFFKLCLCGWKKGRLPLTDGPTGHLILTPPDLTQDKPLNSGDTVAATFRSVTLIDKIMESDNGAPSLSRTMFITALPVIRTDT